MFRESTEVYLSLSRFVTLGIFIPIKRKKSKKIALLLIPSKFGEQKGYRFYHSRSEFELRHLNVPYMTNFSFPRSDC